MRARAIVTAIWWTALFALATACGAPGETPIESAAAPTSEPQLSAPPPVPTVPPTPTAAPTATSVPATPLEDTPDVRVLGFGSLEGQDVVVWFWAEW